MSKSIRFFYRALTGSEKKIYEAPTPQRLSELIKGLISIYEDKDTNFIIITTQHGNPELALSLILKATKITDNIMRERYIRVSKDPLEYYKEKIATARSREHREALATLIGNEEKKLMLASYGAYFVAEPILKPTTSLYPTYPNSLITLFMALIIGLIVSFLIIFLRNIFSNTKVS